MNLMRKRSRTLPLILLLISSHAGGSSIRRIECVSVDSGKTQKIYLRKGLTSVIRFKKPITSYRLSSKSILSEISPDSAKELVLRKVDGPIAPTNLIVDVGRHSIVFDLIIGPNHQDIVCISSIYGRPAHREEEVPISNSDSEFKVLGVKSSGSL